MSSGRPELASFIVSRRACLDGTPLALDDPRLQALGERLAEAGVRAGDVIVVDGPRGRDLILVSLAAWMADAVPMPVVNRTDQLDIVNGACTVTPDLAVVPGTRGRRLADLGATAMLHVSSGSTGRPKIAKRSVASVFLEAEGYRAGLSLVNGDCVAVPIPLAHSLGSGVALSALLNGVAVDTTPAIRVGALTRKIDSGRVSVLAATAPVARMLVEARRQGDARLRAAMVGAGRVTDQLDEAFQARFGTPLLRGYGCSETGGTFLGDRGMGRPVTGVTVLRPERGGTGELVLRLAVPVEGYLGSGERPLSEWRTGDVVRRDLDGCVHFIERMRGPLRLNGRFIDVHPVASAVRATPGVSDVFFLVLPRVGTPDIEDLYAVVEGVGVTADAVAERIAHRGDDGCLVPRLVFAARLPRNTLGKPDRDALIDMVRREHIHA